MLSTIVVVRSHQKTTQRIKKLRRPTASRCLGPPCFSASLFLAKRASLVRRPRSPRLRRQAAVLLGLWRQLHSSRTACLLARKKYTPRSTTLTRYTLSRAALRGVQACPTSLLQRRHKRQIAKQLLSRARNAVDGIRHQMIRCKDKWILL